MTTDAAGGPTYVPSDALVQATIAAMLSPLPYLVGKLFAVVPARAKDGVVRLALGQIVPITLHSIAAARPVGTEYRLVEAGAVDEAFKRGFVARVASWLLPDQVHALVDALRDEVGALARAAPISTSWQLAERDGRILLVTTGTSPVQEYAGTVADAMMAAFDVLKELPKYVRRP